MRNNVIKKKFPIVFGVRNKDEAVLKQSTSGGFFTAVSDLFLENGDSVCGVVFSEDYEAIHVLTNEKKARDKMRGAKYVQSSLGNIFEGIERLLADNKKVLFIGTPCQVVGLKNYICQKKINEINLFTIDIICHGVPSPAVFREHIRFIEQKYGKIINYSFRDKEVGWRGQNVTIKTNQGRVPQKIAKSYSNLYFNSLIIRPSCHKCQFSTLKRKGDITIGDFWRINEENSKFNDNKGVSEVLINSEKGLALFEMCKEKLEHFKVSSQSYIQPNMLCPTEKHFATEWFWHRYLLEGFTRYRSIWCKLKLKTVISKIRRKLCKVMGFEKVGN
ncbi:MAG: Coenzyme F420 hydrogenase/dehydrogenase, beta subunit C-terminal domain [Tyzzerella sp.]|nr:Coenzyme F420 hydrogenase/dehydrogenase, beta subunit C-terminal domain [Tyzzerella sp.]